jgi:hypothetical protein
MANLQIDVSTARFIVERQSMINELHNQEDELRKRVRELLRDIAGMRKHRKTMLRDIHDSLYADLYPQLKAIVKPLDAIDWERADQITTDDNDEDMLLNNFEGEAPFGGDK